MAPTALVDESAMDTVSYGHLSHSHFEHSSTFSQCAHPQIGTCKTLTMITTACCSPTSDQASPRNADQDRANFLSCLPRQSKCRNPQP